MVVGEMPTPLSFFRAWIYNILTPTLFFFLFSQTKTIQEAAAHWRVDYDARSREVPMETDIDVAIEELEKIQFMLEDYQDTHCATDPQQQQEQHDQQHRFDLLQPVTLQATIDPARAPVRFQSTFGRELWFCSLHAVRKEDRFCYFHFFSLSPWH